MSLSEAPPALSARVTLALAVSTAFAASYLWLESSSIAKMGFGTVFIYVNLFGLSAGILSVFVVALGGPAKFSSLFVMAILLNGGTFILHESLNN